ncbi:MAG: aromatic ring-hydroxylating dioxygenase subunit alpha [Alphaproteobacteria bacterium]|nr:aromatic ring-hydroxylating dioxygenase subunit alpha [Alphaproteobacteria bacterium]
MSERRTPDAEIAYNSLKQAEPGLPAAWYYDPDQHAREIRTLWRGNWLYVCRSDELSAALSYRTFEIGDQNIVIVRASGGALNAFHNACRHRGSILCTEHAGQLKSKLLVCPYHQWSYAAGSGDLVRTSSFAEPDGFSKADYPLFKVACAEWRGSVFIHLDPSAVFDEKDVFNRSAENFRNFPLETMVTGYTWKTQIACNWKTFWENFNECLHCPNVHPELVELVPLFTRRIINPKDVPDWQDHEGSADPKFRGGMRGGGETWSSDGSAQGHTIAQLTPEDLERGHTYCSIWPNVFIGGYPDHVRIVRLHPVGPEETELTAEWLFLPETLAAEGYDISNVVDFGKLVMEQDATACELNQKGLHAAPLEHGVLMPEEYVLHRFHTWVRDGLA